jgi:hypothetical protein
MKQIPFFASLFFLLSCSTIDPNACTCGKELAKPIAEQDQDMMNACAQKGEAMSDKEKVRWFEDIMSCVE